MQLIVKCFLVAIVFLTRGACAEAPPNILYIYVDDMGWGSIGPNGQADRRERGLPFVRTPNLDQLARDGVNFVRGYGCHVCSPARSSQQSGFHQGHTYADRNDPNNAKKAMRADDVLMGDVLAAAGYTTGYWGKWGYGGSKDQANPVIQNVQTLPTSHGYQHVLAELHHVRAHTFFQPTLWHAPAPEGSVGGLHLVPNSMQAYTQGKYSSAPALQTDPAYPQTAYCDDSYCFAALDFVSQQAIASNATGTPFFGLLAVQVPHAPFGEIEQLPHWDAAYEDDAWFNGLADQSKQWAAMVTRIDAHIGNILAALEDPNGDGDTSDSVSDNTLVVFQSDNGGPAGKCFTELDSNGGLRGTKGSIQEGGIRVPLVMRWPNKITPNSLLAAGSNCDMVVDVTDLLPTFCEAAGIESPLGIDGVSIAPTLTGSDGQKSRPFIIHEASNGQSIIAGQYKLVSTGGKRKQARKYLLYDLTTDPTEQTDVATDHPEVTSRLKRQLIAERVHEPAGFAVTYHSWTGAAGAGFANADCWSDYEYANAGISYMTDGGQPKPAWIARISGRSSGETIVDLDSAGAVLALELGGSGSVIMTAKPDSSLTARNGLRIKRDALLQLNAAAISTEREVQVDDHGQLAGAGSIKGNLRTSGIVSPVGAPLSIRGEFEQHESGILALTLPADGTAKPAITVTETARLSGRLHIKLAPNATRIDVPAHGRVLLEAGTLAGEFEHVLIEHPDEDNYRVVYSANEVRLVRK